MMIIAAVCSFDIFLGCVSEGAEVKFISPILSPLTVDLTVTYPEYCLQILKSKSFHVDSNLSRNRAVSLYEGVQSAVSTSYGASEVPSPTATKPFVFTLFMRNQPEM
jgi:hypothetical protein